MVIRINLTDCKYSKSRKELNIPESKLPERTGPRFPILVDVWSPYTGKIVTFKPIGEDDPKFDQDQWDGEQMIYSPIEDIDNVKYLVIFNGE